MIFFLKSITFVDSFTDLLSLLSKCFDNETWYWSPESEVTLKLIKCALLNKKNTQRSSGNGTGNQTP